MTTKEKCQCPNTGLKLVYSYFVFLIINGLVLWLANILFPAKIVLGTWSISKFWAIVHSMGILALIEVFAIPLVREFEIKKKKTFSIKERMIAYLLINTLGIWLIARGAEQFGMGISSWIVAVILALVLSLLQGAVMMKQKR